MIYVNTMAEREFSAGGIVVKKAKEDLRILLIKDGYGRWTWPKGNIEKGEASEEAAKREIKEEVGLTQIEIIQELDKIQYFYRLKGRLIFKTVYLFLFEAKGDEKLTPLKEEIKEAKWFSPDEALEIIEYKGAKEILKKAMENFNIKFQSPNGKHKHKA